MEGLELCQAPAILRTGEKLFARETLPAGGCLILRLACLGLGLPFAQP